MKRSILIATMLSIVILMLSSCASGPPKIQYTTDIQVKLAQNIQAEQKKEGITIKLEPIDDKIYEKSHFKQNFDVIYTPLLSSNPVQEKKEFLVDFFHKLTPFNVTIINNTDHILRMRDSRVVFIDPNDDEPIYALDKAAITEDMESLPVYEKLGKIIKEKYPQTAQEFIETQLFKNISKVVEKLKFVNGFNKEIMPDMKYSGIIVFPIEPELAADGKISFIDMVSKTDNAGNPTKKVRFDYLVQAMNRYWRYNPASDSEWKEISEQEYKAGQTKQ